jgi:hypothetical protein
METARCQSTTVDARACVLVLREFDRLSSPQWAEEAMCDGHKGRCSPPPPPPRRAGTAAPAAWPQSTQPGTARARQCTKCSGRWPSGPAAAAWPGASAACWLPRAAEAAPAGGGGPAAAAAAQRRRRRQLLAPGAWRLALAEEQAVALPLGPGSSVNSPPTSPPTLRSRAHARHPRRTRRAAAGPRLVPACKAPSPAHRSRHKLPERPAAPTRRNCTPQRRCTSPAEPSPRRRLPKDTPTSSLPAQSQRPCSIQSRGTPPLRARNLRQRR